jgi:SAM-dependent methyltransferase
MSDWTSGYVADIGYTYGYYADLNPLRIKLAFLDQGLVCPDVGAACELGFGQGLSANMHAAASTVQWSGTDFNPSQAAFAQELATVSGSGARLFDEAFADFANRADLPDFDYIGLHGIWSWISDENRAVIVEFIRRKLKVGGVLYISYNTQPGWAAFAPMRHLMVAHADAMGAPGEGIVSRVEGALNFAEKLMATNPAYARANPLMSERLTKLKGHSREYLAHEYFNRDWHPMHFSKMAEWLEPAKVQFCCSANYIELIDAVNISAEQAVLLAEIPDAMLRQSVRDFMLNQQFRKDYWVKGLRRISAIDKAELQRSQRIILTTCRADVPLKVTGALGEATLQEEVYNPILDLLADHKARSIGDIELALKDQNIQLSQVVQAVMLLSGMGHLYPVQEVTPQNSRKADSLNLHLMQQARGSKDVIFLTSPLTGGGHEVHRFQQLFLFAYKNGKTNPEDWAQYAWGVLSAQNQKLLKLGQVLTSAEDNLAELNALARTFADKQLPVLKALHIA